MAWNFCERFSLAFHVARLQKARMRSFAKEPASTSVPVEPNCHGSGTTFFEVGRVCAQKVKFALDLECKLQCMRHGKNIKMNAYLRR